MRDTSTLQLINDALTAAALDECVAWAATAPPPPKTWLDSPEGVEVLRDIFRGYVAGLKLATGKAPEWGDVGIEADDLLLDALALKGAIA